MARTLSTFVHISDLHFGHVDPQTKNSREHAYWAKAEIFRGLLGHHYVALQRLQTFFSNLRKTENAQLIVSGDLTSMGHPDQFRTALEFLGAKLHPPEGSIGLGAPDHCSRSIPGNHDQWPGHANSGMQGGPTEALGETFPNRPYTFAMPPMKSGHFVRVLSLDTDADVGNWSTNRLLARGEFTSQLATLERMLHPIEDMEIRVLLLHHSRLHGDPRFKGPLVMNHNSRNALDQFLVQHGVQILLCGHTHVANVQSHIATAPNQQTQKTLECCCGTTTQRDCVPPTWKNFWRKWPQWQFEPNTLLVHRIVETDPGQLEWQTVIYERYARGFAPIPDVRQPDPFPLA